MRTTIRTVAVLMLVVLVFDSIGLAVGSKDTAYVGGTVPGFEGAKDAIDGLLDTTNPNQLVWTSTDKGFRGKTFSIPYDRVIDLEYGQKAGRRVGTAVATTVLFGPIGLVSLLSKKRRHFLTVGFKDDSGKDQVAVLEIGKDIVRTTLAITETRSGKKIEYQDEEARNSAK
jgi:hypothetical protein